MPLPPSPVLHLILRFPSSQTSVLTFCRAAQQLAAPRMFGCPQSTAQLPLSWGLQLSSQMSWTEVTIGGELRELDIIRHFSEVLQKV